jgi:hypothetical protein
MKYTTILLFVLLASCTFASELAMLPATRIRYESDGLARSGKVLVEVRSGESGRVLGVTITAFEIEHELSKEEIARFDGFSCNGIIAGFETGFSDSGAIMFITLVRGIFGEVMEKVVISIPRNGALKIERSKK